MRNSHAMRTNFTHIGIKILPGTVILALSFRPKVRAHFVLTAFETLKTGIKSAVLAFFFVALAASAQITGTFFNWETQPVQPLALSPDQTKLVLCNLPDNRLEIFDVTSGQPVPIGNIPVGLDPVSVRFRTSSELWVANYISDSISIVDLPSMRVVSTIVTSNEPSDIVFAGTPQRAFVSCAQPNLLQVFNPVTRTSITNLSIQGNRPKGLAVSPDGSTVYAAIFESGNASTIISTGVSELEALPRPNPINFPQSPSLGVNPPPNDGSAFSPPLNPALTTNTPPRVGLIVKRNGAGKWVDDANRDWTEYIHGTNSVFTGRKPGWDMPDNDVARIDANTLSIHYAKGLMNICMGIAVNPASGQITVVGTDAMNHIRFEPALKGTFIRVKLGMVDPLTATNSVVDLNSHLTYATPQIPIEEREKSIGDPRSIVWQSDGTRGYVTGLGSGNLIVINASGQRIGATPAIEVGAGPTGMALDESRNRLYVYNRFAGSISTVDTTSEAVIHTQSFFDPTPVTIRKGRPHLYDTHRTSGLGQASCGSCHVDSRFDRLAWDLGAPDGTMKNITSQAYNFGRFPPARTNHFHPMKGPMTTQTLQDIIGHEPFHWRGDREDLEEFNPTFTDLQAAAAQLTTEEMLEFKNFLATIRFSPNPFRQFDNTLATNLPLPGHFTLGRGNLPASSPLPNGNPQAGLAAFRASGTGCILCHTLPSGVGTDMRWTGFQWATIPVNTNNAHHTALIVTDRSSLLPFKIAQLRHLYEKTGANFQHTNSIAGFGFFHDGSVDTLIRFVQDGFEINSDQSAADMISFLLSFSGSDLPAGSIFDGERPPGVPSLDTAASVGRQITIASSVPVVLLNNMITLATSSTSRVDLVAKTMTSGLARGWFFDRTSGKFLSDRQAESLFPDALRGLALPGNEQTYTLVPRGTGRRIGIDRDEDNSLDRDEIDFGSDPANPQSFPNNRPPALQETPEVYALNGQPLTMQLSVIDSDVPGQQLLFSLESAPPGATINATNGLFSYAPSPTARITTNVIRVIVADALSPDRSTTNLFSVVTTSLAFESHRKTATGMELTWMAAPGQTYQVQYKDQLSDPSWNDLPGDIVVLEGTAATMDTNVLATAERFYRIVAQP